MYMYIFLGQFHYTGKPTYEPPWDQLVTSCVFVLCTERFPTLGLLKSGFQFEGFSLDRFLCEIKHKILTFTVVILYENFPLSCAIQS